MRALKYHCETIASWAFNHCAKESIAEETQVYSAGMTFDTPDVKKNQQGEKDLSDVRFVRCVQNKSKK